MSPQPYYDQGDTYWCSFHMTDIEQDDPACEEGQDYGICASCPYCEKQSYRIVTKDERFKRFI